MKYWVFQSNQVTGPFDPEDLPQTSGYSADTLVCPEGRRGTNMGDWQRASMVPELSVSILKASQLALAVKGGGYPALPPEPTLKDLAALGSLQEKVSLLDNMVAHLQESLRLKDDEMLSLHKELQDKARYSQELAVKLGGVEERLSAVNALREGLDKAVAAEHDVESTVQKQAGVIDALKGQLDSLRVEEQGKVAELKAELDRLRAENESAREQLDRRLTDASAAAAGASAAAADAALKAQAAKEEAAKAEAAAKAVPPAPVFAAPPPAPAPAPSFAPVPVDPPAPMQPVPAPAPMPSGALGLASERPASAPPALTPTPFSEPLQLQPAGEALKPLGLSQPMPIGDPLGGLPLAAKPASEPAPVAPVVDQVEPRKPAKKGKPLALVAVAALIVGGAFAALKFAGPTRQKAAPVAETPLPPAPEPPKPTPEQLLEEQKKQAVELLRSWQLPDGAPVAVKLETEPVPPGGLSPWFADKIRDGVFQVNFYPPKGTKNAGKSYEFEVRLADQKVTGHNPAAASLLEGKPLVAAKAPAKPKRTAKVKIKPKPKPVDDNGDVLGDLLNVSEDQPAKPKADHDDVLIDGSGSARAQAQAKSAPAAAKRKAARPTPKSSPNVDNELESLLGDAAKEQKPAKAESLDELLLPGVPKRPERAPRVERAARPKPAPAAETASEPQQPGDGSEELADAAPKPTARPKSRKSQPADAALLEDLLKH